VINLSMVSNSLSDGKLCTVGNFYYAQEEALRRLGITNDFDWAIARPSFILGAPQVSIVSPDYIVSRSVEEA
jgi:hypothetical protein